MKENFDLVVSAINAADKGDPKGVISSLLLAIEIIKENKKIPSTQIKKMEKEIVAAIKNLNSYH